MNESGDETKVLVPEIEDNDGSKFSTRGPPAMVTEDLLPTTDRSLFMEQGGLIDFVIAYQPNEKTKKETDAAVYAAYRQAFEKMLREHGLLLEYEGIEQSQDKKTCFVKIHAPWLTLTKLAEANRMKMPVQRSDVEDAEDVRKKDCHYRCLRLLCCNKHPCDLEAKYYVRQDAAHFTLEYQQSRQSDFMHSDSNTFFSQADRIQIVWDILERTMLTCDDIESQGVEPLKIHKKCPQLGLKSFIKKKIYMAVYPLHDGDIYLDANDKQVKPDALWPLRPWLHETWARFGRLRFFQPIDQIRKYFGEKIAMYFAWLGFYTRMLFPISLCGKKQLDANDKQVKPDALWPLRPWLHETWARFGRLRFFQPIDQIRKYFGEKIAMYFAWLGFYTRMLFPISLCGKKQLDANDKQVKPDALWPLRPWLHETWARFGRLRFFQPIDQIRKYFGEKIAMYFAWLGFYTRMLFPISLCGKKQLDANDKQVKPDALWPLRPWLHETWARFGRLRFFQPIDQIRKYFGEKIAMYFAWLGFYTRMLFPISLCGKKQLDANDKQVKPDALWPLRPWLHETWARFGRLRFFQPIDQIRKYFGEKIAMYFAWLGFYTRMLFPISLCGVLCTIFGVYNMITDTAVYDICNGEMGKAIMCRKCPQKTCKFSFVNASCIDARVSALFNNESTPIFALLTSLWGICFLEFWKRKQARLGCRWDTMDYTAESEQTRPEYNAAASEIRKNEVTHEDEPYIPKGRRVRQRMISISFVSFMVTLTLIVIASVIIYKITMVIIYYNTFAQTPFAGLITTITASIINMICIMTLEKVYKALAWKLTELEYPRTDSDFENSYTYKLYIFQFINYYATLFYLAFISGHFLGDPSTDGKLTGRCGPAGCSFAVTTQLIVVFLVKQVIQNSMEFGIPLVKNWIHRFKNVKETEGNEYTRWERDFDLQPPAELELFDEYFEMVMQYGFVTMFVAAFPLAPLFALLNNIFEIRIDANKFVSQTRRVRPDHANGIGSWEGILGFVSRLSVMTNAAVIAVTTDVIDRIVYVLAYSETYSMDGYVDWTLAHFKTADWNNPALIESGKELGNVNVTWCRYRAYMTSPPFAGSETAASGHDYGYSVAWWHVSLSKMAFVLVFEHAVFFVQHVIQYLVPDVPDNVKLHVQRGRHLAKANNFKKAMSQIHQSAESGDKNANNPDSNDEDGARKRATHG